MKKILIIIFLFSINLSAQNIGNDTLDIEIEKPIKRFSLGLKIGTPNMIGGAVQYTLPVLNNHISPYINFSGYDIEIDNTQINLNYSEYGLKLYFSDKAKGLYAGIGASSFKSSLAYKDVSLSGGLSGDGSVDLNIDTTILKLGIKTGGTLYFSLELGYGFGEIPNQLTFNAISSTGISESVTEEIPKIPGIGSNGMVVGNIGFGISF
ncbi:MAG: hypothetical protein CMC81_07330 [Flavobacteriaceae bacterium]|nr:hypothetical protein [Flavobacteriaceae bacterium]|tara:strand:- start:8838 stop:9461 length:624 start_codon:yes stop_codon:yes gene_type:complete